MRAFLKGVYGLVIAGVMVVGGGALVGCETTGGAGRDIEKLGDKIEDAAD